MKDFIGRIKKWYQVNLAPGIPGTREFLIRYRIAVIKHLKPRIEVFKNLQVVNAKTRKRLYRKIRMHYKNIAQVDAAIDDNSLAIGTLFGYLIIVIFLILPFVLPFSMKVPSPWTYSLIGFFPVALVSGFIWYFLFILMTRVYNVNILLYFAAFIVLCVICWYWYGWLRPFTSAPIGFFGFVVFINVFVGITITTLELGAALISYLIYFEKQQKRYSDSYLLINYIASLYTIEKNGADWTNVSFRQHVFGMLESNAMIIMNSFPQKIKITDPVIKPWFDQKINEISASTRNLAKLVLLPREKSDQELIERLGKIIVCLADGNWGGIETAEPEKVTTPQRFNYVLNLLKMLLLAFLPVSAMWFVQKTALALQPPVSDYANAGSIIWALLVILNIFDPSLSQKISSLKDVSSLLTSVGKK